MFDREMKLDEPVNKRKGRVSGSPMRAQNSSRPRVTCFRNHRSKSCAPVVTIFSVGT